MFSYNKFLEIQMNTLEPYFLKISVLICFDELSLLNILLRFDNMISLCIEEMLLL